MEHIEQAGIHSGDSACSIPTQTIPPQTLSLIREWSVRVAKELKVVGLINIQYAIQVRQESICKRHQGALPRQLPCTTSYKHASAGWPLACMVGCLVTSCGACRSNPADT